MTDDRDPMLGYARPGGYGRPDHLARPAFWLGITSIGFTLLLIPCLCVLPVLPLPASAGFGTGLATVLVSRGGSRAGWIGTIACGLAVILILRAAVAGP